MESQLPEIPNYIKELIESGEFIDEILIDKEGTWYHNGEKFINEKIINFFNKSINITADGEYVIHYSNFTYPIKVEDVPFFITGVTYTGFGDFEKIILNISSGESEELNCHTLFCKSNNALYCRVRNGTIPAKFKRSPSFSILERLEEDEKGKFYVRLCGSVIELIVKDE
ncbi:MAG: DUF1285 domain-containing protein [Leptospirales bacterium]|jgi:hypothetical protein|nr:DUF1285 domain-containing protein [Leptospirales bacterium]